MIIDSHLHLSYMGNEQKDLNDVKGELLASMKENEISYAIVIPDNVPNPQCADMPTLARIIDGDRHFFSMGTLNVFQNIETQINKLEELIKSKKICAVKLFPGHDPFYPTDERCAPLYELCEKLDAPVVIHTGVNTGDNECAKYNDPKYIVEVANKYRELKIVIAHYFWPKMDYCYELTKDMENIYYDTSAMADPEVVEATGGCDKVVEILKKTVSLKPSKVMFGTDWPMCPVDKHIQMIKDLMLTPELEEAVFCGNAVALYKLKLGE